MEESLTDPKTISICSSNCRKNLEVWQEGGSIQVPEPKGQQEVFVLLIQVNFFYFRAVDLDHFKLTTT